MAKYLCAFFMIALSYTICQSASIAEEKISAKTDVRTKRTADKISDLKAKLSELQKLLGDIDKNKAAKPTASPQASTSAPQAGGNDKGKGENTLSEADILLLKSLKTALENIHDEQKVDKTANLGHFYEAPLGVPGNQEDDKRTVHDKFYLQDPSQSFGLPQDVLEKVVYRLLSDLDLAFRNDISLEDIIRYLYEKEEAARRKEHGNRIEEEERQLRALLNKEPAPRD